MSGESSNEVQVELAIPVPDVRAVTLRNFTYRLQPLRKIRAEGFLPDAEAAAEYLEGIPVDGLELVAIARDTGLQVSLRFARSEWVNIATGGLAILDAADAAELPEGGETL